MISNPTTPFLPTGLLPSWARSARSGDLPGRPTVTDRTERALDDDPGFRDSTRMLLAMARTGRHIYSGTVPPTVVARRRAANKRARAARRAARR